MISREASGCDQVDSRVGSSRPLRPCKAKVVRRRLAPRYTARVIVTLQRRAGSINFEVTHCDLKFSCEKTLRTLLVLLFSKRSQEVHPKAHPHEEPADEIRARVVW
jgi:hypothetical protein